MMANSQKDDILPASQVTMDFLGKTPNEGYILFHIVRVNSTPFTNGFYRY